MILFLLLLPVLIPLGCLLFAGFIVGFRMGRQGVPVPPPPQRRVRWGLGFMFGPWR